MIGPNDPPEATQLVLEEYVYVQEHGDDEESSSETTDDDDEEQS